MVYTQLNYNNYIILWVQYIMEYYLKAINIDYDFNSSQS